MNDGQPIELIQSSIALKKQMENGQGEGHFYYAHIVYDSHLRWEKLAEKLVSEGLK